MKIPSRILFPILFAILCTAILLIFLWWQLAASTMLFKNDIENYSTNADTQSLNGIQNLTAIDPKDKALFYLRQGDLMAVRGEWAEAEKQYSMSVEAGGGLPSLRKLAQAQLQRRNISGVRTTIRQLKKAGARAEDILLLEGIVMLRQGELVQAHSLFESATDSPQKNYGLALLYIIEGNHASAQEKLNSVISGWEPVLRSNARTLNAAYQEFSLFPESTNIHLITLLARALAQIQECELALPLLVQVTQLKDDYRDAWIVQGYCELVTERPEQALASLEQAYNRDPQKPEIQYFLGRAYADISDHTNAIRFFQYALSNGFTPEAEARIHLAKSAEQLGNTIQALEQYDILIKDPNADLETFYGAISIYIINKQAEEAYKIAKTAGEKFTDNATAYELIGWTAMEAGHIIEARNALEKALEISPFLESAKERLEQLKKMEK